MATALGGEVAPAEKQEVGVCEVALSDEGMSHPFFAGLPTAQKVMQWHHAEVKRAPQGAKILAASPLAAVQSLAIDNHALSTQFHCEFSPQTVATWSSLPGYRNVLERELGAHGYQRLKEQCYPLMPEMARNTRAMYENFKKASGLKT